MFGKAHIRTGLGQQQEMIDAGLLSMGAAGKQEGQY
jgi:hypothetical protein